MSTINSSKDKIENNMMVTSSASKEVQKIDLSIGLIIVPGLGYGLFVTKKSKYYL
jgi:hypothetical protein